MSSVVFVFGFVVAAAGESVLVWISLDGVRHDYPDRAETPVLDRLVREGSFTRALVPSFPTLTFPSHVSQATGAPPAKHGILSNSFYDRTRERTYTFPPFAFLLQAEPIWTAAARQGIRAAVHDWPLSHRQRGRDRTDYFNSHYDGRLDDQDRLDELLLTWREDEEEEPLRLLMGYGDALDKAGHRYGPDAPEIAVEMEALDERLGRFLEAILALFRERAKPGDSVYLFLTTDHGMTPVHTAVNVDRLTGLRDRDDVLILTAGNLAHVYVHGMEAEERVRIQRDIRERAGAHDFVDVYTQEQLPERWGFRHEERGGTRVLVLAPGFVFNRRARDVAVPAEEAGAVRGAHGYDAEADPDQLGFSVFWRYPEPLGGNDLGRVDALRLHATAARVLGIDPAPTADPRTIDLWAGD